MQFAIETLPWLLPAPIDFRARCKALHPDDPGLGHDIQKLATFFLDAANATALGRAIVRLREGGADFEPLSPLRLAVLASSTPDLLAGELAAGAARYGIALTTWVNDYGQVEQAALDPGSAVNLGRFDLVVLMLDPAWLGLDRAVDAAEADGAVAAAADRIDTIAQALRRHGGASVIVPTFPIPPQHLFGNLDVAFPGAPRALTQAANRKIVDDARRRGDYVLDLAALAERVGADRWFSPIEWNLYKLAFSSEFNGVVADQIGRLLGAVRGRSRKCLVLDLDNTLWGGVVGDDGVSELILGQGSGQGEAFVAVQRLALDLHSRGVILAVSSKNEDERARSPFRSHPDMILKEDHIAVFQANWLDKATNIEAIAQSLNLGLDAFVFLDDNAAEREQVRAALPMVAVPELPNDPNWFARTLASAGYFETVGVSDEDRLRAASYGADARRLETITKTRDLGEYLESLDMTLHLAPFDDTGRTRIAQLINKSNQFNLTTKRYTEAQVAEMAAAPSFKTLQVRLQDRFGDLGMISVVIAKEADDGRVWTIDTWLMSCRVLGRRVEEAIFSELSRWATAEGAREIIGRYRPTAKNALVAEHYPRLGFSKISEGGEEITYRWSATASHAVDLPFKIRNSGFLPS